MLSGFVISYAYEARLRAGMSIVDFYMRRAIRLYPLIIFGSLLGAVVGGIPCNIPNSWASDFFNTIGAKRTWTDVSLESVMRSKADIGRAARAAP
jgi:peptidoglycan/LPS O-acetylase OafA/YrhL